MVNHTSQQRMDKGFVKFIKRIYPKKTMAEATRQLAEDLYDDLIYGKRINKKYKSRFKE